MNTSTNSNLNTAAPAAGPVPDSMTYATFVYIAVFRDQARKLQASGRTGINDLSAALDVARRALNDVPPEEAAVTYKVQSACPWFFEVKQTIN